MFKISSFEQELMKEMQSRLVANQAENEYSFNKLSKAADYLSTAAELFDDVGMGKTAEAVTKILEKIAEGDALPDVPEKEFIDEETGEVLYEGGSKVEAILRFIEENNFRESELIELVEEISEMMHPMPDVLNTPVKAPAQSEIGKILAKKIKDYQSSNYPHENLSSLEEDKVDISDLRSSKKKV